MARQLNSQFEWTHHVPFAIEAGVREEAMDAVRDRTAPAGLSPEEALVFNYTRELIQTHAVSSVTFQAAADHFGPEMLTDLTITIGYFLMLDHLLAAFDVELEPELEPLLPT